MLTVGPFGDQMGGTSIYSDILWAISCTQAQICGSQKGALQACTEELNSRLSPQLSLLTERLEPPGVGFTGSFPLSRQKAGFAYSVTPGRNDLSRANKSQP